MVSAIKQWLGIDVLEGENVRLARALKAQHERIKTLESRPVVNEDHEARIDYLEKRLTSQASEAKIVPKAAKANWKQFRTAVEVASEPKETE